MVLMILQCLNSQTMLNLILKIWWIMKHFRLINWGYLIKKLMKYKQKWINLDIMKEDNNEYWKNILNYFN